MRISIFKDKEIDSIVYFQYNHLFSQKIKTIKGHLSYPIKWLKGRKDRYKLLTEATLKSLRE